eukprot:5020500-Pyramimonas_sp.AAC.1
MGAMRGQSGFQDGLPTTDCDHQTGQWRSHRDAESLNLLVVASVCWSRLGCYSLAVHDLVL